MQDLEPNMEDLFRSAAESLPLKDEDNWQQVAEKLSAQSVAPHPVPQERKNRRRYLFLFLMLLFLLTASWWLINYTENKITIPVQEKTDYKNTAGNPTIQNEIPDKIKEVSTGDAVEGKTNEPATITGSTSGIEDLKEPPVRHGDRLNVNFISGDDARKISLVSPGSNDLNIVSKKPGVPSGKPGQTEDSGRTKNYFTKEIAYDYRKTFSLEYKRKDSVTHTAIVSAPVQQTFQKTAFDRRYYYGAIAGPGYNSVQNHDINKTGFEAGVLGGYKLSRKLFLETGIYFSKNFYEAKAVSFNQKGIEPMLSGGRELNEVHGSNFLLKLPINLRYNFTNGSNQLFASTGVSSFMVTRESNWYVTTINGNSEMLYGDYRNKRFYFGGAVNFSAGLEKRIYSKYSLRIQPYVQLPIQGVGIGNLHLMSTGLHLGLIRSGD